MERRQFLRTGTLAWAGLSLACERKNAPGTTALPVVISTWDFGRAANSETVRRLEGGVTVLDAVQQGVMQIEADPDETSVGIGGYPNREGVVELDHFDGNVSRAAKSLGLSRAALYRRCEKYGIPVGSE